MRNPSRNKAASKRLHLALSERDAERLDSLAELTNASSSTEVIKRALLTYEALAERLANGAMFLVKDSGDDVAVPLNLLIDIKMREAAEGNDGTVVPLAVSARRKIHA